MKDFSILKIFARGCTIIQRPMEKTKSCIKWKFKENALIYQKNTKVKLSNAKPYTSKHKEKLEFFYHKRLKSTRKDLEKITIDLPDQNLILSMLVKLTLNYSELI